MDKDKKERLDKVMNILKQEKQDFDNFNKTLDTNGQLDDADLTVLPPAGVSSK